MFTRETFQVTLCLVVSAIAIALAQGCGKIEGEGKVHVDGNVNHTLTVDIPTLEKYFRITCSRKNPGDQCYSTDEQTCVDCSVADFIDKVQ